MLDLTLPPDPTESRWEWPTTSRVPEPVRKQIEAAHSAPQRQRVDEVAELRATVAQQAKRIEALEAAMRKRAPTKALLDGISEGFAQALRAERANVAKRLDELDQRVGSGMPFKGVHEAGATYDPGDVCVRSGSSWIALTRTADVPGEGATGWSMLTKRGRDGRDFIRKEPTLA